MNPLDEYMVCARTVRMLLHVFADITNNKEVGRLPLNIELTDADTASTSQARGMVTITMPREFQGHVVTQDNDLMLGLGAHELAHLPDLETVLRLMAKARQENPALPGVFNLVEDVRIETGLLYSRANKWLTRARQAVHDGFMASLQERRKCAAVFSWNNMDLWDALMLLRFGDPQLPMSHIIDENIPLNGDIQLIMGQIAGHMRKPVQEGTPASSLDAARAILCLAQDEGIQIPPPPPNWGQIVPAPNAADPDNIASVILGTLIKPDLTIAGMYGEMLREEFDHEAFQEGARLAARISPAWGNERLGQVAVGVGRYNPRLEGSGLPPFTMPLSQRPGVPRQLLLLIDTSDSMWDGSPNLHYARVAATAITLAAQATGSQVTLVPFWAGYTVARSVEDMLTIKGSGTTLTWLPRLAEQYPDHHILIVTDADVMAPPWSQRDRSRTTCIYIPLGRVRRPVPPLPNILATRVLCMDRPENLPYLITLAARRALAVRE